MTVILQFPRPELSVKSREQADRELRRDALIGLAFIAIIVLCLTGGSLEIGYLVQYVDLSWMGAPSFRN